MNRPSKKSETLQVRLPHGIKRDFMERCRLEGRAASEVLRGFIDSYLARPVEILTSERTAMARRRILYPSLALAAVLGAAAVMVPHASQAGEDLSRVFDRADTDRDGLLSAAELPAPVEGFAYQMRPSILPASAAPAGTDVVLASAPKSWAETAQSVIDDVDQDRDRRMNLAEFRVFRTSAARLTFLQQDLDHDGRLSKAEFMAFAPPSGKEGGVRVRVETAFARLDRNGDGYLSAEEHTPA